MTDQDSWDNIIVSVRNLKKYFPIKSGILMQREVGAIRAVDDVSFEIYRGETLGLIGESGSGKSTTGRTILQLYRPTEGNVYFEGEDLTKMTSQQIRLVRRQMQIIFQDPYASLNPRMTIGSIVSEPLFIHNIYSNKKERQEWVENLLERVGLNPYFINRYPHEFSGGQRQRVGIARAMALNPSFIIADEPISALDVSIQAQVVNLMQDLQEELNLTYLFIAHDLSMVRHICQRVAVMYRGRIVELGKTDDIYDNPLHPYTKVLLSAVPIPDPEIERDRERLIMDPNFDYGEENSHMIEVESGHWIASGRI